MFWKTLVVILSLFMPSCFPKTAAVPEALPRLPDASLLDNSEITQIQALKENAIGLLAAQDYDGLEKMAQKLENEDSSIGAGFRPITFFYDGLSCMPGKPSDDDYQKRLADLNAWSKARPGSVAATVALADVTVDYAWFARGGGYANTVTQDGWEHFSQRLEQARQILIQVEDQNGKYSRWYEVMARLGMGQSWDGDRYLTMIKAGAAIHPQDPEIYNRASYYLLPRWFGKDQDLVNFATKSADDLGGDEGDILYARIAKGVWCYSYDTNVFEESGFSWPRVKHGMELICNRYPHSTNMMNWFCLFATQAGQRAEAKFLFDHLGNRYYDGAGTPWWRREDFDQAKAWAEGN